LVKVEDEFVDLAYLQSQISIAGYVDDRSDGDIENMQIVVDRISSLDGSREYP